MKNLKSNIDYKKAIKVNEDNFLFLMNLVNILNGETNKYKFKESVFVKNIYSDFGSDCKLPSVEFYEEEHKKFWDEKTFDQWIKLIEDKYSFTNLIQYENVIQWYFIYQNLQSLISQNYKEIMTNYFMLFIVAYEEKMLVLDFVNMNIINQLDLQENFMSKLRTKIQVEVSNELENLNDEQIKIKLLNLLENSNELITKLQKNIGNKNWISKLHKTDLRFKLILNKEVTEQIYLELKGLAVKKPNNKNEVFNEDNFVSKIKVADKAYKFNRTMVKNARKVYINFDRNNYLSAICESYFKNFKLENDKKHHALTIIKLASLAYSYKIHKKFDSINFDESRSMYELLLRKFAYKLDAENYVELNSILNETKFSLKEQVNTLPDVYLKTIHFDKLQGIINWVFKSLNIETDFPSLVTNYYVTKNELHNFKVSNKSITFFDQNEVDENKYYLIQSDVLDKINHCLASESITNQKSLIRFITETFGKLYLSDKPKLSTTAKVGLSFSYAIILLWSAIIIVPILLVIIQSFNYYSSAEFSGKNAFFNFFEFNFSLSNYTYLWEDTLFKQWLINSIVIGFISMSLIICLSALSGYVFSRFRFKGKKIGLLSIMLIQTVPTIASFIIYVVIASILESNFSIPPRVLLISIYVFGSIPGNTFLLKGYMDNLSSEIDDAAKIDGCGNWTIFTKIILPLAKPMLSVIALWSFLGPFGDVILPAILARDSSELTMASGLQSLINATTVRQEGAFAAGALVIAIPITVMFMLLQKNITTGLSAAGVKG